MANSAWYPFYPGDHARDTGNLTLMEEGALRRLLDHYYSTGGPLPPDFNQLFRICRAFDENERTAVKSVLSGFFVLSADGWCNSKADKVVEHQEKIARRNYERTVKATAAAKAKRESVTDNVTNTVTENATSTATDTVTDSVTYTQPEPEPEPEPKTEPEVKGYCPEQSKTDCPGPSKPAVVNAVPVVLETETPAILLPLVDKTDYPLSDTQVSEYSELYPAVDVMGELRKMRAWLISNPRQKKTRAGILRFVNYWLSKEQDKGGKGPGPGGGPVTRGQAKSAANMAAAQNVLKRLQNN